MITNSTSRFSSRVENYVRYRPGYPAEVLDVLRNKGALNSGSMVADIGSGTGLYGVEPNAEMRAAGERALAGNSKFISVDGTAEATTLPAGRIDLITAAQAFHWFDRDRTRAEFTRILKPGGWVALIWNDRQVDSTPFLRDYEALLRTFATDYVEVRHKELDLARVRDFIGSDAVTMTVLANRQVFDYDGLRGRLLSSSYAPDEGQPGHVPMLRRLEEIFQRHQSGGTVAFEYDTQVYCAQLPTYSAE